MSFKTVERKALNLLERSYLPALLNGFKITLRHFFGKKVTMQYPRNGPSRRIIEVPLTW